MVQLYNGQGVECTHVLAALHLSPNVCEILILDSTKLQGCI